MNLPPAGNISCARNVPDFAMALHRGDHDRRFSVYGPRRFDASFPYEISFGDLRIIAMTKTVDLPDYPGVSAQEYKGTFEIRTQGGSALYDRTPDWWMSRIYLVQPDMLGLFDEPIEVADLWFSQVINSLHMLEVRGKSVCQATWKVRHHVQALIASGVERCRFLGICDPFLNEADRLAFLGEVLD